MNGALGRLSQVMNWSVRTGLATTNPVRGVERVEQRKRKRDDLEQWTAEEVVAFREVTDGDVWAAAWRLSLCGLRRSEVLGLRWSDVDLSAGVARVRKCRVAVTPTHAEVGDPKSEVSERDVPVELMHSERE